MHPCLDRQGWPQSLVKEEHHDHENHEAPAVIAATLAAASAVSADDFTKLWYDGAAEISTYRITEMRYGEPRQGVRAMVFVTEPLRQSTHIKPDVALADSLKINVIKLNDIRKFVTGIYDYSVMTSVFASVEAKAGIAPGATVKVSFSGQEWCGNVFERLVRNRKAYDGVVYSYFESEGEKPNTIVPADTVETEDKLWLAIRELQGPVLSEGESMTMAVVPPCGRGARCMPPVKAVNGYLRKGTAKIVSTAVGSMKAIPFTWVLVDRTTTAMVESAYPHRILSWQEPDGSTGAIVASRRSTYWDEHANSDLGLRSEHKLITMYEPAGSR